MAQMDTVDKPAGWRFVVSTTGFGTSLSTLHVYLVYENDRNKAAVSRRKPPVLGSTSSSRWMQQRQCRDRRCRVKPISPAQFPIHPAIYLCVPF
jgi:hypothetical protein